MRSAGSRLLRRLLRRQSPNLAHVPHLDALTVPEVTLAGVALVEADGTIDAMVGVDDPTGGGLGHLQALVRRPGGNVDWEDADVPARSARARFEQSADGNLRIVVDDNQVLNVPFDAPIAYVSIYYVRHKNSSVPSGYAFGDLEIREITVCH